MFLKNIEPYTVILASQSPRRQKLLKALDFPFEIRLKEIEEIYPENLKKQEIPIYLAELKSNAFKEELNPQTLLITSDTVVCIGEEVLGKPLDQEDAKKTLRKLSGKKHTVYTGVCIASQQKKISFYDSTDVYFCNLTEQEIDFYIENYQPFDKAGSYGIQEWIGYVGIEKIDGSYFNVMGLPIHKVYEVLKNW